jgi:hypothetical protein
VYRRLAGLRAHIGNIEREIQNTLLEIVGGWRVGAGDERAADRRDAVR